MKKKVIAVKITLVQKIDEMIPELTFAWEAK
jgi:hypothetical protein